MNDIQQKVSLKPYNTFGIDVFARFFVNLSSTEEIQKFCHKYLPKYQKYLIIGGGSNILFTNDFNGIVIHICNKGIEIAAEDSDHVLIKAGSGEIWDDLVRFCVNHNYGGMENLSNIPGTVGAAPVQNIGAYGVELKDVFDHLEAIEINTGEKKIFSNNHK